MIKTKKKIFRVAIFGDAEAKCKERHYLQARKTGRLLAKAGFTIVNGGGPGVMLAATVGAKKVGGKVEIVIIDPNYQPKKRYEGVCKKNFIMADKVYKTRNYPNRLRKLVDIADAFVVFKGGTGTLSELALVWEMAKFDYGDHEPVIFVGKAWQKIVDHIEMAMKYEKVEKDVVFKVRRSDEVVDILKQISSKN